MKLNIIFNILMQKKESEANEWNSEYKSNNGMEKDYDEEDTDSFVDNLKHFTPATQSRFIEQNKKDTSKKTSTASNETNEDSRNLNKQDFHKMSSSSYENPNQVRIIYYLREI